MRKEGRFCGILSETPRFCRVCLLTGPVQSAIFNNLLMKPFSRNVYALASWKGLFVKGDFLQTPSVSTTPRSCPTIWKRVYYAD